MNRPLRIMSARYAEARQRNTNGALDLSNSDFKSTSTSMTSQHRRTNSAAQKRPVSRPRPLTAQDAADSGSKYPVVANEQDKETSPTDLERARNFHGPYTENHYSESKDSGIGGVNHTPPSDLNTTQAGARGLVRVNTNLGCAGGNPRFLERFPDLGPEPVALVEAPCASNAAESSIGASQNNPGETDDLQQKAGNGNSVAPGISILERTKQLLRQDYVPRAPSTEGSSTASRHVSSRERGNTSPSNRQSFALNVHLPGNTSTVSSRSAKTNSNLKINACRSSLPPSSSNRRPIPASTAGLSSTKRRRAVRASLHATGYGIEDTAQAFKDIEGQSEAEAGLVLEGHLDKIFGIVKEPEKRTGAFAGASVNGVVAEADDVVDCEDSRDRCLLARIGGKVRGVLGVVKGLGREKRGGQ